MNWYTATFEMPFYGYVDFKAENEEEAKIIAKQIRTGERIEVINWDLEGDWGELAVISVIYLEPVQEEKELSDNEWFVEFQKEFDNDPAFN